MFEGTGREGNGERGRERMEREWMFYRARTRDREGMRG